MPLTPLCLFLHPPLYRHLHSPWLPHPSTAQASAPQVLKRTLSKQKLLGTLLEELRSLTGPGPIFGNMLIGCLRVSSESHYFFPKWNFSWKAIKIERIKIFTRLIRLHTSSGLIHHKQENSKRHLTAVFLPGVFSAHHKAFGHDSKRLESAVPINQCSLSLCIQGGSKLEGHKGLCKQELWASGNVLWGRLLPSASLALPGPSHQGELDPSLFMAARTSSFRPHLFLKLRAPKMLGMTFNPVPKAL